MSKTFWDNNGKLLNSPIIDGIDKCKWLCDYICCNEKSSCVGDYPESVGYCDCEGCKHYEQEKM